MNLDNQDNYNEDINISNHSPVEEESRRGSSTVEESIVQESPREQENVLNSNLSVHMDTQIYNIMNMIIQQRTAQLEDDMLNAALLESRELYEQTDINTVNEDMKVNEDCVRYSKINIPQKRKQTCSICLSNFKCSDNLYKISCNHLFHKDCLDEWVKHKQECPVCRCTITCTELKN